MFLETTHMIYGTPKLAFVLSALSLFEKRCKAACFGESAPAGSNKIGAAVAQTRKARCHVLRNP